MQIKQSVGFFLVYLTFANNKVNNGNQTKD